MVQILRNAGLSALLDGDAVIETLADGFQFTEGPLWCPDGSLLFQDIKAERTYRLPPGPGSRPVVLRENTRAANGQTFAADGRIVFCEQNGRRVSVMNADGSGVETVAETFQGKRLNSPNDTACRASDGLVYFTDPPYGVAPADKELPFHGVYALDLTHPGDGPRLLIDDFEKPNGLAFSPDEATLYVCDTAGYHVRAFAVDPSGSLKPGSGRVVASPDPESPGGPDGTKVDRDGRLYVAVAQGVWVFEPGGKLLGIIALPKRPSNLAWCDPDGRGLAMTAVDTVYKVRMNVAGVIPPFTPKPSVA
jgi:gluconolactonase